jgi:putative hydrolase of the HAD superfamily
MPQAVLLDLFNTVIAGGDAERDSVTYAMAGDLGVDPALFTRLHHETWPQRCRGQLGDLESTVRHLAVRAGGAPSDSGVRLACARRMDLTRRLLWPRSQTLAALDAIRAAGWPTGLVSNTTSEVPALWKSTPLAVRFDTVAFSSTVGTAKPDPAIYLSACGALGVRPEECVYLGDGADGELAAAASLGMSVVRTTEYRAPDGGWAGRRVASITDFAMLLGTPVSGPRG